MPQREGELRIPEYVPVAVRRRRAAEAGVPLAIPNPPPGGQVDAPLGEDGEFRPQWADGYIQPPPAAPPQEVEGDVAAALRFARQHREAIEAAAQAPPSSTINLTNPLLENVYFNAESGAVGISFMGTLPNGQPRTVHFAFPRLKIAYQLVVALVNHLFELLAKKR